MLDHVSITVCDIAAAERFYDAIMAALGVVKVGARSDWLGYGERCRPDRLDGSYISIRVGALAEPALGRHWCFKAPDRAAGGAFWTAGIAAGGIARRAPGWGVNTHPEYYASSFGCPHGD